ncbi:hypothetical protein [Pseudoalteromonas marina]|uniref:Uncharacterized protein n=1 Tax=Pseudoalteromonas marina TaxID=267375 RepID=A0ABT9FIV8_9GAMM|nr:hypothetical protein [Pseudoalteromonas marina]MDP2566421.1 hypothetical protein [Pseudoalteromonas marina]
MKAQVKRQEFSSMRELKNKIDELNERNIHYTQDQLRNGNITLHWAELESGFTKSEEEKMIALDLWMEDNYEGEFFSIVFDAEKNITSEQVFPVWKKYFSKILK